MRKAEIAICLGSLSLLFLVSMVSVQSLPAQTQPTGTSVSVRMIESVDSAKDPAGKQYRATVTKTVDAGNGVTIPQGAFAIVTLVNSGSGWSTQLVSVNVNGHAVAVTSSPATMAGGLQSTASNAVSAVGSMLGSFGHHVKPPTAVTAVASGQRVVLPPGTALTFALTQPPAASAAESTSPPAPSAPAAPGLTASAAPAPGPGVSPAPNSVASANGHYTYCFTSQYSDGQTVAYFSEVFPAPKMAGHEVGMNWGNFLRKKYAFKNLSNCIVIPQDIGLSGMQTWKRQREDGYRKEKKKIVETDWKYTPAEAASVAPAPAPTTATTAYYAQCAAMFGGRADEHCAAAPNEYYVYCYSANLDGPVMYFSDVFPFNATVSSSGRDISAMLAGPYLQFLETKFGVKVSSDFYSTSQYTGGTYPTSCSQSFTPLSYTQEQRKAVESNITKSLHKQIVETGWKTTIVPLPAVTVPPAAANEHYVSCYSDAALTTQYFSAIFAAVPTGDPIPNAFLAFLQKKYGFNDTRPGPHVDCEVSPKPGDAYMFKNAWSSRQQREGTAKVSKYKVVETGWKYTPE